MCFSLTNCRTILRSGTNFVNHKKRFNIADRVSIITRFLKKGWESMDSYRSFIAKTHSDVNTCLEEIKSTIKLRNIMSEANRHATFYKSLSNHLLN